MLSTHVLQVGILIAILEMTWVIYLAAYVTITSCAEHSRTLGTHRLDSQLMRDQDEEHLPWPEIEDRGRVWWAVGHSRSVGCFWQINS